MEEATGSDVRPLTRLCVMEGMEGTITDEFENYDVFISHRGPDTKTGFVGFLYEALETAGLRAFLDCKSIDKGQDAWKCIVHAIRMTPVVVVIFSESFAQSEWCLNELHVMLETPSVKVLPIFYKVQPFEVRFPEKGQLAAGFEKLKGRHDEIVIEQWRADLRKASKLNGWEYKVGDHRLERDLVTEVVQKILELANKPLPLDVGEHIVGVQKVASQIIHTLAGKKKVLMLGLWGMGGIGKSTLARELYNQLSKRFAASCYVEDLTEKVIQGGVVKVQNQILKDMCKDESMYIEDKSRAKIIMEERLCKKQVLVVLDDVSDKVEMHYLITRNMLLDGSLCIVTSRNKRVFEMSTSFDLEYEIHLHNVQVLDKNNSKQVFTSFAFGGDRKLKPGVEELVANISNACGGVPLVLKVCGALLKGEENVDIWVEVMNKLNCGTIMDEIKIFECLRISYDVLQKQHQEMFLDVACVLFGQSEDMARRVRKSRGWSPALGIRSLVEKALIVVDGEGCFTMHDHLRDMGREIERIRRTSEGIWRRLWMPESLSLIEEGEPLPDSLQTLVIWAPSNHRIDIDLSHMKRFHTLICDDTINVTSMLPKYFRWFGGLSRGLFGKFIYPIHTDGLFSNDRQSYGVGSISAIAPPKNLVILILKGYKIQSLPESFGDLNNLEVLNLSYCRSLILLPDSFGRLRSLQNLQLKGSGIRSLPESFGDLNNLEVLNLAYCGSLILLPDSFGRLRSLQNLQLKCSGIQSLPESFGDLSNLEVLNLASCGRLILLRDSFGRLRSLQNLQLGRCGIQSLPESFGDLSNLEVLDLAACERLILLQDSFGRLQSLQNLQLKRSGIQSLPESFGDLSNLTVLNLSYCQSLILLPDSFGRLKSLQNLELQCSAIRSLPESFGKLSNLEVLDLAACERLILLRDSFGRLKSLQNLQLKGSGIQSLPESFGDLSNLEVLNLASCRRLILLPDSFGRLRSLQNLQLELPGIQSLPESFGDLSNLEVLKLASRQRLILLPDSFGRLKSLQNLQLELPRFQSLPESFGDLSNLEVLNLAYCRSLILLPDSFGRLRSLRNLQLKCSAIQSLPESFGDLSNLEVLNLAYCRSLILLPDSFGRLKSLQNLQLKGSGIQSLPESFGDLSNLEVLNVAYCRSLILLPDSFERLRSLQNLQLKGSGIQSLPESFGDLSNLEVLNLDS